METVRQLLLICVGVMVINLAVSLVFWAKYRTKLHRGLVLVWGSSIVAGFVQSFPAQSALALAMTLAPSFLVSLAHADLIARIGGFSIRMRLYLVAMAAGIGGSLLASFLGAPFWLVNLPVAAGVALPLMETPVRGLFFRTASLGMSGKAVAISCMAYGAHMLDFPFLRNVPGTAAMGFTLALLVIFGVSITAPAAVLERVAEERTKIEELNRFQRQFFANITHELRTPLTMIIAPIEGLLAEDFGPLTPTQRAYLEANHRNALRLLKLINDLLDLAKKEEGFLRLRPERNDLRSLLDEVVAYARPLANRKKLTLDLIVENTPQDLHVDGEKMERVVVNLISNALKFTSKGGVTVTLDSKGGQVELAVTDTGIGIAPEALPRIFERFTQGDGSVTRRYGGTGIGLAYAREIVTLHGGDLTVDSTPGQGSRFVVRLLEGPDHIPEGLRDRRSVQSADAPTELRRQEDQEPREWALRLQRQSDYRFAEIGDAAERREVSRSKSTGEPRVLVVEDHEDILEFINLQLREGYTVFVAPNGRLGLEVAQREHPDLIVTDYMMPEMDGLTMIQALRQDARFAETPILMLTAKGQLEDRLAARAAGIDAYLAKPFNPKELRATIEQLLERRGRHVNSLMRAHAEGLEIVSGGLAHEIQNPLNFIKGAQLMILENVGKIREQVAGAALTDPARVATLDRLKERIDRLVKSATEGVSRIEGVVAIMRRYAREGYPKEASEVAFDQAVKEVTSLVAPPIEADCQVELDLKANKSAVHCIPEEFNQLVRSLVQNAVEAVGEKGVVRVQTRQDGKSAVLEVMDNGPGIAPDAVARIFSPFFTTKTGNGRGLGLAIAQLVVSRANGAIEVASVPGKTTFRVRLPLFQGEGRAPVPVTDNGSKELNLS